ARGEKAAEHDPTDHCRKNEPKLRIYSSINSHVTLHGRPWFLNFQPLGKLPGTRLMRCRRAKRRIATKRNRGKRRAASNGRFGRAGIELKRRPHAFNRESQ